MTIYQYATLVTAAYILLQISGGLTVHYLGLRRFIIFHLLSGFVVLLLTAVTAVLAILARNGGTLSVSVVFAVLAFFSAVVQVGTGLRLYTSRPDLLSRHLVLALLTFGLAVLAAALALI